MALARSFKDYVAHRFYNELFTAIADFLKDGAATLNISSYSVRSIDNAELSDIRVMQVYVDNRPDIKIAFDVLVEAEIVISENDRHNDRYDEKTTWFKVSCAGDLSRELNDFAVTAVCEYNSRSKQANPMDDALVPFIKREQLEKEATDFLQRYYPEALKEPTHLDPAVLAERMGLTVNLKHITEDFSVFGQIHFADGESQFYDKDAGAYVPVTVKSGEIFVDPDAFFLHGLGSVNNTIVHECVHWDKHRKAFKLERLYNNEATQIKCQVVGGVKDIKRWTATDRMEWQANALTPRIQMPYTQTKVKAFELIQKYKHTMNTGEIVDIMEAVIAVLRPYRITARQ